MSDRWPNAHEGFGNDAFEWWRIFNGLMPGGAWSFIRCDGKRPIESWPEQQREPRMHVNTLRGWRGNIGYPCGLQPSGLWLVVVDVDPRTEGATESLNALRERGMTINTVTTLTGGEPQGQHLWFMCDVPVRKATFPQYPGIDFIAEGGMVIVPPSFTVHRYEHEYGWSLDGTDIASLPAFLVELLGERHAARAHVGGHALNEARELLEKLGGHTWVEHYNNGAVWADITRPGKDNDGRGSATVGKLGNPGSVHVFSTNWHGLPAGSYDLRALRTLVGVPQPEARITNAIRKATADQRERFEPEPEPPVPLDAIGELPPFPVDVFPEWLRTFATQLAHATQTPVDLPCMIILAALAAASGGRMIAVPRSGWEEPTNLFVAVAMPPASRKSPVFRPVVEPLRLAERALVDATRESIAAARAERSAAEQRAKALLNEAAKAKGDEADEKRQQAVAAQLLADAINVPTLPRILASDATPEALTSLLATYGGRIAVMSAEGGVFDQIAGRYTGKPALDVYLNGHAGDALHVDRIGRPPEYIARPALTIGITTQPSTFRALARVTDIKGRGLLGRFLWSLPRTNIGARMIAPEPVWPEVLDTYVNRMCALAQSLAGWETDPYRATFMPLAGALIEQYEHEVEPTLAEGGELGHVAEWGGKLVGHTVRIAALLHLAEGDGEQWRSSVNERDVEGAIAVARYLKAHALAVFAFMRADEAVDGARAVLAWAEAHGETFSQREAHRALQARFRTVDEVAAAIATLLDTGNLIALPVERGARGRPASPRFRVFASMTERPG